MVSICENKVSMVSIKWICILISALVLQMSCTTMQPLMGTYSNKPYTFTTALSKDKFWDRLIDFFTTNGVTITTIDKQSGVIVSANYSFVRNYTNEDLKGNLIDPKAWVVINFNGAGLGNLLKLWGDITIHVTEENGTTKVIVTLNNLGSNASAYGYVLNIMTITTTGVFEKTIGDLIAQ
jgi:hypothetical protein